MSNQEQHDPRACLEADPVIAVILEGGKIMLMTKLYILNEDGTPALLYEPVAGSMQLMS